jgi:glycosyltransferase involved in cell wall biosynthesis
MEYFERKTATTATAISSPSLSLAKKISRRWRVGTPISVEPLPFRLNQVVYDESQVPTYKYVLYFGRIEIRNGVLPLAKAIRRIQPKLKDIRVLFVGADANYGTKQNKSVKERLLRLLGPAASSVSFMGPQEHERLYPLIRNAEFVVLPSLWENFSYACLEAMALGKTVIGPSGTGFAEQIRNRESGLLFKRKSHRDLARKMLFCLENPERVQQIGVDAQKRVADFDAGKMTIVMLRKYHETIGMDRPLSTITRPESPLPIRWLGSDLQLRARQRALDPEAQPFPPTFNEDLDPDISVIVPSFNEEEKIQGCLVSLLLQVAAASYEIIIVDSSSDSTARIILERFPRVVLISSERRLSCGEAKNVGLSFARGNKILFTDADIRVPANWVQEMANHLDEFDIAGGPFLNGTPNSLTGTLGYCLEFFRFLPQRTKARNGAYFTGGNSGYRREAIKGKKFISGIGEDIAFSYELIRDGKKAVYDPTLGVVHLNKVGFKRVLRYQIALGAGGYRYRRRLRFKSPIMRMPILSFVVPFAIVPFITLKLFLYGELRDGVLLLIFSPLAMLLYLFWAFGFYTESQRAMS